MDSLFSDIKFGPFSTAYHAQAVDEAFQRHLFAFLEAVLLPQVDEPFDSIEGTVTAEYNDEKYSGPNSAVRDAYRLKISFIRPSGSDTIEANIYRNADKTFRPQYSRQPLYLWTMRRKDAENNFRAKIDALVSAVRAESSTSLSCPRCGTPLTLVDSPTLFDLSCPQRCFNYNFHRDPETGEFIHGHFFSIPPWQTKTEQDVTPNA